LAKTKDILLHICCGPCLIYPYQRLKEQGFKISGFYYNPNIQPPDEYERRVQALKDLNREFLLDVEYPGYHESDFLKAIQEQENIPQRCLICWSLRLRRTASQAKLKNFKIFSTTLLVSPYQDHEALKKLGSEIGQEFGVEFYYEDFRLGFRQAQAQARQKGIYRQKYCGCIYSREQKKCLV
jgi:predicted adenine nucleotide alpha hydrolase (AANH) superfamily ATPase